MPLSGAARASPRRASMSEGAFGTTAGAIMKGSGTCGACSATVPPSSCPRKRASSNRRRLRVGTVVAKPNGPCLLDRPLARAMTTEIVARPRLFLRQQIPYLLEQHLLARRRRGFRLLMEAQPVHALHGEEDHPGNEEKIDARGDEIAPGEHRALLLGVGERGGGHGFRQREKIVGEIKAADRPDHRHDNVADEGSDDRAERRHDDDADGEIDDASLERKGLEFLEHGSLLKAALPPPYPPPQAGEGKGEGIRAAARDFD